MHLDDNMSTITVIGILILLLCNGVRGDFFVECENATSERIFIESNKGCSFYIFCDGMDSFDGECDEGFYFSKEFQTCDPKDVVECHLDAMNSSSSSSVSSTTSRPQTPTGTTTTMTPTRFNSSIIMSSITTLTMDTSISTTLTSAVTTNSTESATTTIPSLSTGEVIVPPFAVLSECPVVDNPNQMVFVPHPKSCSDYFMCYHGKKLSMHCSAMLHFNIRTGKCDYPENGRCQINYTFAKDQCQSHTVDVYPHPGNCNYYFYCRNGYLMLEQCPLFFGWDMERRACISLKQAKCYNRQIQ